MRRSDTGRALLVLASVSTGALGALTIFGSEARLGGSTFAPLAQLWTLWALFSASVTFGVQQWVIRLTVLGLDSRDVDRRLLKLSVPVALAVGLLAGALIDPWFDGHVGFPMLAAGLVVGTAFNGLGRGRAAARGAVRLLATLVVGENLIRSVLLVPLMLLDASPIWYGLALLAGFSVNFLVGAPRDEVAPLQALGVGHLGLLITALVGLISYATMFGGPLLLAPTGVDGRTISALFLVVTVARIPFVVVIGLLPRVASHLEELARRGEMGSLDRFGRRIVSAVVAGACTVGITASVTADSTLGHLLGTSPYFGSEVWALIGAASIVALGALVMSMTLVAVDRVRIVAMTWSLPVAGAVLGLATGWLDSVERLAGCLALVETLILTMLLVVLHKMGRTGLASRR